MYSLFRILFSALYADSLLCSALCSKRVICDVVPYVVQAVAGHQQDVQELQGQLGLTVRPPHFPLISCVPYAHSTSL